MEVRGVVVLMAILVLGVVSERVGGGEGVVLQSDHFDSQQETTTQYVLGSVQEGQAMVLLLRKE